MRRCPLVVFALLTLWMVGDHPAAAQTAVDNCPPRYRKDPAATSRALEVKKQRMRKNGVPDRYLHLLDKMECVACIETAPDTLHITVLYNDDEHAPTLSTGVRDLKVEFKWSAQSERQLREELRAGQIRAFYVWIHEKRCNCCPDLGKTAESYADWDDDIGANMDETEQYDDPDDLGTLPDDLKPPPPGSQTPPPPIERFDDLPRPSRRVLQATCQPCEELARQWTNESINLNFLWDRKIEQMRRVSVIVNARTNRSNEIQRLEYEQRFDSTRSYDNLQTSKKLKEVNEAQEADQDKAEREIERLDQEIRETEMRMEELMQKFLECEKACKKTTTTMAGTTTSSTPPPPTAGTVPSTPFVPRPSITIDGRPNHSGDMYAKTREARAACPECQSIVNQLEQLNQQRRQAWAEHQRLQAQFEAIGNALRADDEAFRAATGRGDAAAAAGLRARLQEMAGKRTEVGSAAQAQLTIVDRLNTEIDFVFGSLEECNRSCKPPTTTERTACAGSDCSSEWNACAETNSCTPIDEDCGVPGTCALSSPSAPTVDLSDPTYWGGTANVQIETGIQIKGTGVFDVADFPQFQQLLPLNNSPSGPSAVIPPAQPQDVHSWLNPLGLLARRVADQIERWRGSVGPRPLLNPRDFERLEGYTSGQSIGLPKGVHVLLTDRGGSTGKTLSMQILNLSGKPVRLATKPFAIEPIRQQAQAQVQQAFNRLAKAAPVRLDLAAYCLEFLKAPPGPNQIFRLAPAAVQKQFEPVSKVLRSAYRVQRAGLLRPDSNPAAYSDAISQWAVWSVEQKFNQARFTDAFVSHTKKNVESAGQRWTRQAEEVIRKVSPNRWQDIVKVLAGAGVPVSQ